MTQPSTSTSFFSSSSACELPSSALRGLIRDFTDALAQQMFFWGRDVVHLEGNLLCAYGFERRASEGLDGTSCYRLELGSDLIELHGACVGRYAAEKDGFLFIRTRRRCFLYRDAEPPAPGIYVEKRFRSGSAWALYEASCRFLDWWLEYEAWITDRAGPGYRASGFQMFRKLPKSRPWLPPEQALDWLKRYANDPSSLRRAREWKRERPGHSRAWKSPHKRIVRTS